MKKVIFAAMLMLFNMNVVAQNAEWHPVSTWPFEFESFQNMTIYAGNSNTKIQTRGNIHVLARTLWYESRGKRLQAKAGTVKKVLLPNGRAYYDVMGKLCSVLSEDTINGSVCRLYLSAQVDKPRFDEMVRINRQSSMNVVDLVPGFQDLASGVADSEGTRNVDQEPLPMINKFYMLYNDEVFEATEGNILKHLTSKEERNAYRAYTRNAEVMYSSIKSMLNVWNTFFVK